MKKILITAVVIVIAIIASIPLWGGCDLNARLCSAWCGIKHINSELEAAGCRARCSVENLRCHGEEAAEGLNEFLKGLDSK